MNMRVRLRIGGRDSLASIEAAKIGKTCELVGQRNIDIAIGGLDELYKLSLIRTGHHNDLRIQDTAIESRRSLRTGGIDPPNDLRIDRQVAEDAAGGDPFRAVCQQKVAASRQMRSLLQNSAQSSGSCANGQRSLIDHQFSG